jgi:hypothetical protein
MRQHPGADRNPKGGSDMPKLALFTGLAVALAVFALPVISAKAHMHTCHQFRIGGDTENLMVRRGPVRCSEAQRVIRDWLAGHGVEHGSGPEANRRWIVDNWTCGHGAGGGGCIRGGSSYRNARDVIEYWIAGR